MLETSQLETDEELAHRLQQEELSGVLSFQQQNIHGNISSPLLYQNHYSSDHRNAQDNQRQVRRLFLNNVRESQHYSPKILLIRITFMLIEIIATTMILSFSRNEKCKGQLRWWVLVFSARNFITIPLHIYLYRNRQYPMQADKANHYLRWLNIAQFLWFLVGQILVFSGNQCEHASILWRYCLVIIIIAYITLSLPLLILLGVCLCFPCVLLVYRYISRDHGANDESIRKLPTRTFQKLSQDDIEQPASMPNFDSNEEPSCSICMAEYTDGDQLRILPCEHKFHVACIDQWLPINKRCPLCRHDVTKPRPQNGQYVNNNSNNSNNECMSQEI